MHGSVTGSLLLIEERTMVYCLLTDRLNFETL